MFEKGSDIATYMSKLKNLANRLIALNVKIDDNMVYVLKVLATLPDEFNHFASAWDSTDINKDT